LPPFPVGVRAVDEHVPHVELVNADAVVFIRRDVQIEGILLGKA